MESTGTFMPLTLKTCTLAVAIILVAGTSADALRMTKMSKEQQTAIVEPRMRTISLKLPLRQPVFHWTFQSKEDLLAGKLVLRIHRNGQTTEIVIFEDGHMSDGWEPIAMPNPKAGEIYFGFQSSKKYRTAPNDKLAIELYVKEDLDGIGSLQTGILPAGTYKAQGSFSGLLDEYKVSDQLKDVPKETLDKLRKTYEFKAFLENWMSQWPLKITGDEGWLPAEQRQQMERMLEKVRKEDEAANKSKGNS
jgi:hypothetical protein